VFLFELMLSVIKLHAGTCVCAARSSQLLAAARSRNISCRKGETALHDAASNNHLEIARLLLEHGAEVNQMKG
jgi:ankyrin repeat protein